MIHNTIKQLALKLPGGNIIDSQSPVNTRFPDLASLITLALNIAFLAGGFLAFYFLVWGGLSYIMAQGKKEELAKARAKLTWAIIGFIVILLAFMIAKFIGEIFMPDKGGLPF